MTSMRNGARGSALLAALIVVILVGGLTGAYVTRVLSRSQAQTDLAMQEGVLRGLEGAIGIKLAQLRKDTTDLSAVYGVMTGTTISGTGSSATGAAAIANPTIVHTVADGTYPTTPDAVVGTPDGTLKAAAQAAGTYFNNASQFTTWMTSWLSAHNNVLPGGV